MHAAPTGVVQADYLSDEVWLRLKALASSNSEIKLPKSYLGKQWNQLAPKQLAKVQRLMEGM